MHKALKHLNTPQLLTPPIDLGPYMHDFAQTLSRKKLLIFRIHRAGGII